MELYTKGDILKGGPGLDGYAYQAAVYCEDCTEEIVKNLEKESWDWIEFQDSEQVPQPVFFGESDCSQHCDGCRTYLYGGE